MKPRYISLDEMEIITEKILHDYGFHVTDQAMRVPIEEIIEFHYDLNILWEKIDNFDPHGLVMAAIIPSERRIIMNETHRDLFEDKIGTMNFTFAHELGHWVLHANEDEGQVALDITDSKVFYCRSVSKKPPIEFQADQFAGCLLMPRKAVNAEIARMKSDGEIRFKQLYDLAERFGVSISALCVRLEKANLLFIDPKGSIHNSREEYHGQLTLDL